MTGSSNIELKDLRLNVIVGTYSEGKHKPDHHLLDLTLKIDSKFVVIREDSMESVFDYDPLVDVMRTDLAGPYSSTSSA